MTFSVSLGGERRLRFRSSDITGAVGDSITVLPIVVALALLSEISLAHVLIGFGVFQIVWGIKYGVPISVEPMKALAALAIAGALSYSELALAGLILGVVLLGIGYTRTLEKTERWIGEPVIRGVQFAVGLLLFETGVRLAIDDIWLAMLGILITAIVVLLGFRKLSAIAVLAIGIGMAVGAVGWQGLHWPGLPSMPPVDEAVTWNTGEGVFAQLAMTIGNAALATSLMVSDLFGEEVSPDALSRSMGVMNLIAIPAGGIPMCHGCDGVAGKYEFGARTGGANVIMGIGYLGAAFVFTTALIGSFPISMLGVLLVVVSISLIRSVGQSSNVLLSGGIGILAMVTNLGIAFVIGVIVYGVWQRGL